MSRETSLPAACQRAQVQLSERKRGELDLAQQAALEAHLSSCETCRRLERGTAKLADLLRRGTPPLEASTRAAVWQRIEAESAAGGAAAPGRRWLWGFALACACALLVVALWAGGDRGGRVPSGAAVARSKAGTAVKPVGVQPSAQQRATPRRFRVVAQAGLRVDGAAVESTAPLDALAEVEVRGSGLALLASDDALVLVEAGTRLRIGEGGAELTLERGRLHVRTRPGLRGTRRELAVHAGQLSAEPVGTHYTVTRGAAGAVVDVHEGRVRVTRDDAPHASAVVAAGHGLTSRGVATTSGRALPLARLEALARMILSGTASRPRQLTVDTNGCLALDGVRIDCDGATSRAPVTATAASKIAQAPARPVKPSKQTLAKTAKTETAAAKIAAAKTAAAKTAPAKTAPAKTAAAKIEPALATAAADCKTRPLERLLASGKTAEARAAARARLARCPRAHGLLATIVAESLVREGKHSAARDAYLALYLERPKTQLGMSALYMAGSIELDQQRRPAVAAKLFRSYLKRYPMSGQRQDAFYMLWRAEKALGKRAQAAATAKRYRAAYPHGRYLSRMR